GRAESRRGCETHHRQHLPKCRPNSAVHISDAVRTHVEQLNYVANRWRVEPRKFHKRVGGYRRGWHRLLDPHLCEVNIRLPFVTRIVAHPQQIIMRYQPGVTRISAAWQLQNWLDGFRVQI